MNLFRKKKNKTVYIGLSGGVDSAVSAALLKDAGYNVIACFIKTWAPDGYPCPAEQDKFESMRVAAHLRIPWIEINAEESYKKNVAEYMLNEYKNGRTPNGDVFCNTTVKFGTFYDLAMKKGADYIATGHYAQTSPGLSATLYLLRRGAGGEVLLYKGIDPSKDQSYFLCNVPYQKLQKTLFPIGNLPKTQTRKLAKKYKLPNAERPDSQGVCFLGPIDMKSFIKEMLNPKSGNVLDIDGNIIGNHDGSILYTIGERHGFQINNSDGPYFVIDKNINDNTITVDKKKNNKKFEKEIYIQNENWLPEKPKDTEIIDAVFRYHGEIYKVKLAKDNKIIFENETTTPAEGQSVVFYNGEQCLGGGIIMYK